ncbi:MAG: nucleotide exchange factor GrpE [Halovenus sp.]
MSEQDADDTGQRVEEADEPPASGATDEPDADQGDDLSGDENGSVEAGEAGDVGNESLSDIAAEPAEDVETVLTAIISKADDVAEPEGDRPVRGLVDVQTDPAGVDVDDNLATAVEDAQTETVARVLELLRREREQLARELEDARDRADDFESRLKRKQADFQNYKKRQQERLEEEKQRATEDLVARLLDVRDNLERALDQGEDVDIRGGVETTLDQFDEQLARENVEQIRPEPGQETDPQRHEVLATVESDQPADTIADVHRTGYEMGGKVLRPAQVVVSDGENAAE